MILCILFFSNRFPNHTGRCLSSFILQPFIGGKYNKISGSLTSIIPKPRKSSAGKLKRTEFDVGETFVTFKGDWTQSVNCQDKRKKPRFGVCSFDFPFIIACLQHHLLLSRMDLRSKFGAEIQLQSQKDLLCHSNSSTHTKVVGLPSRSLLSHSSCSFLLPLFIIYC